MTPRNMPQGSGIDGVDPTSGPPGGGMNGGRGDARTTGGVAVGDAAIGCGSFDDDGGLLSIAMGAGSSGVGLDGVVAGMSESGSESIAGSGARCERTARQICSGFGGSICVSCGSLIGGSDGNVKSISFNGPSAALSN